MRLSHALAVAALFGAGCFSTPSFSGARDGGGGDDDGGGSGSDAGPSMPFAKFDAATNTLSNTFLSMQFDSDGWHAPKSLTFASAPGDENLSFTTFYKENGIGMSLFHTYQDTNPIYVVGHGGMKSGTDVAILMPLETGPARAKVQLTWSGRSPCDADTDTLRDNTMTFTVYPDGRLLRSDVLHPPDNAPGCQPTVEAFNTFAGHRTLVTKHNMESPVSNPHPNDNVGNLTASSLGSTGWACLENDHGALGYTWRFPSDASLFSGVELGRYGSGDITFGYVISENSNISNVDIPVHLEMAMHSGNCTDLGPRLEAYQAPVPAQSSGIVMWNENDDAYHVTASEVTFNADLPSGTAFVFPDHTSIPVLAINDEMLVDGTDYLSQMSGDEAVVWLKRPVLAGQALKVDPN